MRVINHTRVEDDIVRVMLSLLTRGITRQIKTITFSYTKKWSHRGRVTYSLKSIIKVAFAKNESGRYPFIANITRHPQFNFPKYQVNNETEACLVILAHEIYHLRAYLKKRRNTEKRAETFAFKTLQKWRENWS